MKMKKLLAALLAALMLLSAVSFTALADETEEDVAEPNFIALADTGYAIAMPEGFYTLRTDRDDYRETPLQSIVSDDPETTISLDVYFYNQEQYPEGFDAFMKADCEAYNGHDLANGAEIDGIKTAYYFAEENLADDVVLHSVTVGFEFDGGLYQVDVNWAKEEEKAQALQIANDLLATKQSTELSWSSLGYAVTAPFELSSTEPTTDNAALVGSYYSHSADLGMDVFRFEADAEMTFEEIVDAQAKAYNAKTEVRFGEANGIRYAGFATVAEDNAYHLIAILENPNGGVSDLVFTAYTTCHLMQANSVVTSAKPFTAVEEPAGPVKMILGDSGYRVTLPVPFNESDANADSYEEGFLGNFFSENALFEFDVYTDDDDRYVSLAAFNEADAANYNGYEIMNDGTVNGIPVASYLSVEEVGDRSMNCINATYAFENGYVQMCFYYTDPDAVEDIKNVFTSVEPVETKTIAFGDGYSLIVPASFEGTDAPLNDEMYFTHYESPETGLCIYTYEYPKGTDTLESFIARDAAAYDVAHLGLSDVNGITVAGYDFDYGSTLGEDPMILATAVVENANSFSVIDFVLDGLNSYALANQILHTLAK
ncbi:MAG: hypothetical protein Q4C53_09215 [Clostridia bacterium]|nr:hypothetical protein [Clostridia bacterium]